MEAKNKTTKATITTHPEFDRLESLLNAYVSTEKKLNSLGVKEAIISSAAIHYKWQSLIHPGASSESLEQASEPSSSDHENLLVEKLLALVKSTLPKALPMQGLSIRIEDNKVQICISAYSSLDELQKSLEQ